MRVRGFPFGDEVERFMNAHQMNFIVEQNRDAQLRALLTLETGVQKGNMRSHPALQRHAAERRLHRRRRHGRGAGQAAPGGTAGESES